MRLLLPFLLLSLLAPAAVAEDPVAVQAKTERDTYYVNEPFTVTLVLVVDAKFRKDNLVQMFQNRLDVPIQVRAPWTAKLGGATLRPPPDARGTSFALNGSAAYAEETTIGGRSALTITRTYLAQRPGELTLAAPTAKYAWGTNFVDDFVNGRTAKDRRDDTVTGKALTLKILPLPPAPPPYGGAVGRFTLAAEASARSVEAGETFDVVLRIGGTGNFEQFETPRFPATEDWHVLGVIDDRKIGTRTVTYQVAALHGDVHDVPPVEFTFFDTREAMYVTVPSPTIPIEVTGGRRDEPESRVEAEIEPDPHGWTWWLVGAGVVVLAALLPLLLRRKPGPDAPDAAAVFDQTDDLAEAFAGYLATRLGCAPAAVISPDLERRLKDSGVPADLAGRAAAMLERLVAARYGGEAGGGRAAAKALVDEFEAL